MNQNLGNIIKEIRKKNNLTQKELADILGVTYQAVSKWERGLNIPDIEILKEISDKYDISLEELIVGENKKEKKKYILIIIPLILLLLLITWFIIHPKNETDFELKEIKTTCDEFILKGVAAYSKDKTSIHISRLEYCGTDKDKSYDKITCAFYEKEDDKNTLLSTCEEKTNITLESFLKDLTLKMEHEKDNCRIFKEDELYLELVADNKIYIIPIILDNKC